MSCHANYKRPIGAVQCERQVRVLEADGSILDFRGSIEGDGIDVCRFEVGAAVDIGVVDSTAREDGLCRVGAAVAPEPWRWLQPVSAQHLCEQAEDRG